MPIYPPPASYPSTFRNLLHNGGMEVMQRGAGSAVSASTANHVLIDRWNVFVNSGGPGSVTSNYDGTTPPAGFSISHKITVGAADASLTAAKAYAFYQNIEGLNVQHLMWGSSAGRPVVLSFWVRISVAGTYSAALRGTTNNIGYPFTFTVAANTWTFVTINIPPTTLTIFSAFDTSAQLMLEFNLGSGSNFIGPSAAFQWQTGVSGAPINVSGTTQLISTTGATFAITGVQLEVGTVATPFERRPPGIRLALCQRYFYLTGRLAQTNAMLMTAGQTSTTALADYQLAYPVTMRAAPALISSLAAQPFATSTVAITSSDRVSAIAVTALALNAAWSTPSIADVAATLTGTTATIGRSTALYATAAQGYIGFSAEI